MNISVKNMLFAFVTGLIVFSLIMTAICIGKFNSEVPVAQNKIESPEPSDNTFLLDKAIVFKVSDENETNLNFAVLTMIDMGNKNILLTPIYGNYLVPYQSSTQSSHSAVSNIYTDVGDDGLVELVKAFSGILINKDNIVNFENVTDYTMFKEKLSENENVLGADINVSEFAIEDFELALKFENIDTTNREIVKIDIDQTVETFKYLNK